MSGLIDTYDPNRCVFGSSGASFLSNGKMGRSVTHLNNNEPLP